MGMEGALRQAGGFYDFAYAYVLKSLFTENEGRLLHNPFAAVSFRRNNT